MNQSDDPAASASGERIIEAKHAVMEVHWNRSHRTAAEACEAVAMAWRVLGETSIIHHLRSLAMSDLSSRRRLARLALPLTALITYAAADAQVQTSEPAPPEVFIVERDVIGDRIAAPDGEHKVTEHVRCDPDGKERRGRILMRGGPDLMVFSRLLGGEHYY